MPITQNDDFQQHHQPRYILTNINVPMNKKRHRKADLLSNKIVKKMR